MVKIRFLFTCLTIGFLSNLCFCKKPDVIAHRGASGYLPEQTKEAKVMAYMMNADRIEIDVILSKDDKLIVCHDILIDELTNVRQVFPDRARDDKRFYVFDFTYDELKQLNITERLYNYSTYNMAYYPNRFPIWKSHFQLHSFPEGLEMIEGLHKTYKLRNSDNTIKNISYLIEIKRPYLHELNNKPNLSDILMDTLTKYGYNVPNSPIIIQSFDPYELMKIKKKYNTPIRLVQLLAADLSAYPEEVDHVDYDYWNSLEGLRNISSFAIGIAPEKSQLVDYDSANGVIKQSEVYKNAKNLGLSVYAWTFRLDQLPKYANSFNELLDIFTEIAPLDGFITDFAADVVSYLAEKSTAAKLYSNIILMLLALYFLL